MTKQSFPIPEGCKAVTVEQVGNQIITTFEPEFKRGDVLIAKSSYGESISVLNKFDGECYHYFVAYFIFYVDDDENSLVFDSYMNTTESVKSLRHATPEEAQLLWDALAKEGKRWNPETMQVEPIKKERWRAENDGIYYSVDIRSNRIVCCSEEYGDDIDNRQYTFGNYFQTEEQAKRAADRLKAELDKFWEEELR